MRGRAIALASMLLCLTLIPAVAWAGPTPEQTIAAIQAKAQAAANWIDNRADQYYDFLASNPSNAAALTELNKALADMNAKAAETEVDIRGKMAQHPGNQDVQDEGNDAIADVWNTASTEGAAITAAYSAYVGGTTTTTTTTLPPVTTTLPTVTTTLPTVTTTLPTVTTTLPKVTTTTTTPPTVTTTLPTVTTLAGSTATSTTTMPGAAAGPTTTTTTPTTTTTVPDLVAAAPPLPPEPPLSMAALASRLGTMASAATAQPRTLTRVAASGADSPNGIGSVLELVRISLPAAVVDPIIDVFIILQAVAAAFVSGVLALAWPAAALLLVVLVQAAKRWRPGRLKSALSTALFDSMG